MVTFVQWTIRNVELKPKRRVGAGEGPFGKLMKMMSEVMCTNECGEKRKKGQQQLPKISTVVCAGILQ